METFTPDDTTFHETVELPEDVVDQRAAASVRVGLEAALDNTHYLRARTGTKYEDWSFEDFVNAPYVATYWDTTSMADGTVASGTAIEVEVGTVVSLTAGDLVIVHFDGCFTATAQAGGPHSVQLVVLEDGVPSATYSRTWMGTDLAHVHMHCVHEVNADATVKVKVQGMVGTDTEVLSLVRTGRLTVLVAKQGEWP